MRMPAVRAALTPTRLSRGRGRRPFRKGRGLPLRCPPREIELSLQALDLSPQSFVLAISPFPLLPFTIAFTFRALSAFTPGIVIVRAIAIGHAAFMADSRILYKYKILDPRSRRRAKRGTR
jgi:hypothetical protein